MPLYGTRVSCKYLGVNCNVGHREPDALVRASDVIPSIDTPTLPLSSMDTPALPFGVLDAMTDARVPSHPSARVKAGEVIRT